MSPHPPKHSRPFSQWKPVRMFWLKSKIFKKLWTCVLTERHPRTRYQNIQTDFSLNNRKCVQLSNVLENVFITVLGAERHSAVSKLCTHFWYHRLKIDPLRGWVRWGGGGVCAIKLFPIPNSFFHTWYNKYHCLILSTYTWLINLFYV